MDELVQMAAAKLGVGEGSIRTALGVVLNLIKEHADSGDASDLLSKLPGSEALLAANGGDDGGGLLGGLGSVLGGGLGNALGAAGALKETGLDSDQMGDLLGQFAGFAKERAGDELVDRVMGSLPGLGSMLG